MKPSERIRVCIDGRVPRLCLCGDEANRVRIEEIGKILDEWSPVSLPSARNATGAFYNELVRQLDTLGPGARVTLFALLRERYYDNGEIR